LASQAKSKLENLVNEQVEETLKYSHIAILVIDAMEAF